MKEYDFDGWINAREAMDLQLENTSLKAEVERYKQKSDDRWARIVQLQDELAEYQDKPEALERLRKLLRKERQMRKADGKRLEEVCVQRDALQVRIDNGQYGLAVIYDSDVLLAIENCNQSYIEAMFQRAQGLEWADCQKRGYEIISVLILEDEESEE